MGHPCNDTYTTNMIILVLHRLFHASVGSTLAVPFITQIGLCSMGFFCVLSEKSQVVTDQPVKLNYDKLKTKNIR